MLKVGIDVQCYLIGVCGLVGFVQQLVMDYGVFFEDYYYGVEQCQQYYQGVYGCVQYGGYVEIENWYQNQYVVVDEIGQIGQEMVGVMGLISVYWYQLQVFVIGGEYYLQGGFDQFYYQEGVQEQCQMGGVGIDFVYQ